MSEINFNKLFLGVLLLALSILAWGYPKEWQKDNKELRKRFPKLPFYARWYLDIDSTDFAKFVRWIVAITTLIYSVKLIFDSGVMGWLL